MAVDAGLEVERELFAAGAVWVIGIDEVGRGAIAGPVAVGVAAVRAPVTAPPPGLRDSKLLSEKRRNAMIPEITAWVAAGAVGLATAIEVDAAGIMHALALAAKRALADLHGLGVPVGDATLLLDGSHDWLSPRLSAPLRIITRVKADRDCASVAAASVLAKVHRDTLMIEAASRFPAYGWEGNKGYGSAAHFAAIAEAGLTELHRSTWLPAAKATAATA